MIAADTVIHAHGVPVHVWQVPTMDPDFPAMIIQAGDGSAWVALVRDLTAETLAAALEIADPVIGSALTAEVAA
ncbi:hypothetical protein [Allonocardiopsis opalescens]|uniref:Uncharacterized protein n=1 Tax=Allonocardiopsis opalescens TaxID=1144618 RepID=A0A2T0PT05_9ACTN|nr:hypothetical protein [Allonocardiopsis opalescens]PRX92027.1 hypothetical protein CLV72_112100 [Allonocardiopsis opalescens]